jgi:hypothetical protein
MQVYSAKPLKSSILRLIDFTTPEADWLETLPSVGQINYWHIINRIKIRQRIIPINSGNMIVTAGYAEGCTGIEHEEYDMWIRLGSFVMANIAQTKPDILYIACDICKKELPYCRISPCCDRCSELVKSIKIHRMGDFPPYYRNFTVLTAKNHMMCCRKIDDVPAQYHVDVMCKSVTKSEWKDLLIFNNDAPVHLGMIGVHNEHCFNKHSPCKCKELSKQIFAMNLVKYTNFKYVGALSEVRDVMVFIMKLFITIT